MFDLQIDVNLEAALVNAAMAVPGAIEETLDYGQQLIDDEAARQEAAMAARPVPRNGQGNPRWTQTGVLAASRMTLKAPGQRVTRWNAIYAGRRFGLGYAWMPKNPAEGIIRRNDVPGDTLTNIEPELVPGMEQKLVNALGLGS